MRLTKSAVSEDQDNLLIIINGAPRTGKNHIAEMIADEISNLGCESFSLSISDHVKEITHELYQLNVDIDAFELVKDIPNVAFHGQTPRAAYINVSNIIRKEKGPQYLGNIALRRIGDFQGPILLPGAGFLDEIEPLLDGIGRGSALLLRLEGDAWDSRSRLEIDSVATIDVAPGAFHEAAFLIAHYAVATASERRLLTLPERIEAAPKPHCASFEI